MIRFAGLDFLRGLGVFAGVVLVFYQMLPLQDPWLPLWYLVLPLFALVSGGAYTVTALQRIHRHPWQLVFRWSLMHAGALVLVGLLGKFVFGVGLPAETPLGRVYGLLPWAAGLGTGPQGALLYASDVVTSLGVALVPFSLVMRWIFRKDVEEHFVSHWVSLALWTLTSLGLYLFLSPQELWRSSPVLKYLLGGFFPLTVALAGLFAGSLLGLPLIVNPRGWIRPVSAGVVVVPFLGILLLQFGGFGGLAGWVPFLLSLFFIALFLFCLVILGLAHPTPGKTQGWFRVVSRPLRSYGRLPLTLLLLSPLTALGVVLGGESLGVSWSALPPWGVPVLALAHGVGWGLILKVWKRGLYRGSPDWLVQYLLRLLGKPSGRLLFLKEDE